MIRESPSPDSEHSPSCRERALSIAKGFYFAHLFLIGIFTVVLLVVQPGVRSKLTFTLALILIYGFMIIWLLLFNLISVLISRQKWAVWCNRFIAKMIIMSFPFLCILAYSRQHFLNLPLVAVFMIYQLAISVLMIAYELYACTCGHHDEPRFLYHPNDLVEPANQVWNRRKEFFKNRQASNNRPELSEAVGPK